MKQHVKILVLGDDGVGKSSLICTLISNHFPKKDVPNIFMDVSIPAEATEDGVQVTIMDSSGQADTQRVKQQILETDSIVLVYDVQKRQTLDNLLEIWLPAITRLTTGVPVIIAGNKVDEWNIQANQTVRPRVDEGSGAEGTPMTHQQAEVAPLLEKFRNVVWACFECSAKIHHCIDEVFYMAQIVVTHPIGPIFDLQSNELTPKCAQVMRGIFRYFDRDCDGVLSFSELQQFQMHCFGVPLAEDEIYALRKVLAKETDDGLTRTGVTVNGFLGIFKLFISKHQPQVPWTVMRLFGYDDKLDLVPEQLKSLSSLPKHDPDHQVFKLSRKSERFLTDIFYQFASTRTGGGGGGGVETGDDGVGFSSPASGDGFGLGSGGSGGGSGGSLGSSDNGPTPEQFLGSAGLDSEALSALRMDAEGIADLFEVVPIAERGRTPWAEANWKEHWTQPCLVPVPNLPPLVLRASPPTPSLNGSSGDGSGSAGGEGAAVDLATSTDLGGSVDASGEYKEAELGPTALTDSSKSGFDDHPSLVRAAAVAAPHP